MIKPILDRLIVKPQEPEDTTSGGLIIANATNDGIIRGTVVSVGPGAYDKKGNFIKPDVSENGVILLHTQSGVKFEYEGEEYQAIDHDEIVAVLS